MPKKLILSLLIMLTNGTGFAEVETARQQDIAYLIELMDSKSLAIQVMDEWVRLSRPLFPDVPDEFWVEFKSKSDMDEWFSDVVPIFKKYFTAEEIKELISFYSSPIGKKIVSVQGSLTLDLMTLGQAWGKRMGMRALVELVNNGYNLPDTDLTSLKQYHSTSGHSVISLQAGWEAMTIEESDFAASYGNSGTTLLIKLEQMSDLSLEDWGVAEISPLIVENNFVIVDSREIALNAQTGFLYSGTANVKKTDVIFYVMIGETGDQYYLVALLLDEDDLDALLPQVIDVFQSVKFRD